MRNRYSCPLSQQNPSSPVRKTERKKKRQGGLSLFVSRVKSKTFCFQRETRCGRCQQTHHRHHSGLRKVQGEPIQKCGGGFSFSSFASSSSFLQQSIGGEEWLGGILFMPSLTVPGPRALPSVPYLPLLSHPQPIPPPFHSANQDADNGFNKDELKSTALGSAFPRAHNGGPECCNYGCGFQRAVRKTDFFPLQPACPPVCPFAASQVDISLSRLATFSAAPTFLHDVVSTQFGLLLLFAKVEL